jgi:hypothetical protein
MTTDPYRVAYESALAEITEITAKFEQLLARKGQIENLITVLQPMCAAEEGTLERLSTAPVPRPEALPEEKSAPEIDRPAAQGPASYSYLDVPNPLPDGTGDPFQRRGRGSFRFRGLAAQKSF